MMIRRNSGDGPSAEERAYEKYTQMMIDKVRDMQQDWHKPWVTPGKPGSEWPENLSGRKYSGGNALMLMLHAEKEGYEVPVYATFERIISMNRDKDGNPLVDAQGQPLPTVGVKRGERSFPVFLVTHTVVDKETRERIKYDDWKAMTAEERARYNVYPKQQVYNVFNVTDQTNLQEARPELYRKLVDQHTVKMPQHADGELFSFQPMDVMVQKGLWYCPIKVQEQDRAFYSLKTKDITVPTKEQFVDGESWVGTLSHEMVHSMQDKLGLLKPSAMYEESYAQHELEAELGAALVCQRYGIVKPSLKDESAAYLKSWLTNLNETPDYLKTVLAGVKKETGLMTQRIDAIQDRLDQGLPVETLDDIGVSREENCITTLSKSREGEEQTAPTEAAMVAEEQAAYHRRTR